MRNSADELFVEGTCNVFGVDVCVVLECYGIVVLLWWSFVGYTVYCVPVGVPSRFLSCFCLSSFCVLFCCIWVVVGVCLGCGRSLSGLW